MIYFFFGADWKKARDKAKWTIDEEVKRGKELVVLDCSGDVFMTLKEFSSARGLFNEELVVFVDKLIDEDAISEKDLLTAVSLFKETKNSIVVLEGENLERDFIDNMQKMADIFEEFDKQKLQESSFNTFALSDALFERNRKKLWILYRRAIQEGISAENVQGVLFWAVEMMSIASVCDSHLEAGVSAYPFRKAKEAVSKYGHQNSFNMPFILTKILHETRKKGEDLEINIEKFILNI